MNFRLGFDDAVGNFIFVVRFVIIINSQDENLLFNELVLRAEEVLQRVKSVGHVQLQIV